MSKRKDLHQIFKIEKKEQPTLQKKRKISEEYINYINYREKGNNIDFTNHKLNIYDIILITTDKISLYFNRVMLYNSGSQKFRDLSMIQGEKNTTPVDVFEHSSNLNQLLNWICRQDIFSKRQWLIGNYDIKNNFHNISNLIKLSFVWDCADLFNECWDLLLNQPLPWPIKAIEETMENCLVNSLFNIERMAKAWMKKVNEMKACSIKIEAIIIGDPPSELFWNTCISLGVNPVVDDVKIQITVPLLAILPNVQSIPNGYRRSLIDRMDHEITSSSDNIVNIMSMMSMHGASGEFLKYRAITSCIKTIPPIEDKKMSELEKYCSSPIYVRDGGWFRALYHVSTLIKDEKIVPMTFKDDAKTITIRVSVIDIKNFAKLWRGKQDRHYYKMNSHEWDGYNLMQTPLEVMPRFTSIPTREKMWNKECIKCGKIIYLSIEYFTLPSHDNELCGSCYKR
jgi:hypothetical protein